MSTVKKGLKMEFKLEGIEALEAAVCFGAIKSGEQVSIGVITSIVKEVSKLAGLIDDDRNNNIFKSFNDYDYGKLYTEAKKSVIELHKEYSANRGDKIAAIKKLRNIIGMGLKESKDVVDSW
jgi:ribosomal protein L7/L12